MGNKKNGRKGKISENRFDEQEKENLKESGRGSWFNQDSISEKCKINCEEHSASFHKLGHITTADDEVVNADLPSAENYIINVSVLQETLNSATVCSLCKEGFLVLKEDKSLRQGVVPHLYVSCSNSDCSVCHQEFPIQRKQGQIYDINRRTVLGARASGGGQTAIEKMFAFMGLPPPPTTARWRNHQNNLADEAEIVAEENMVQATSELKTLKRQLDEYASEESNVDVAVSFDGSWNHVGHSGSFCVVYAISIDTGKIIDYEYKYKICKMCSMMEGKKGTPEYDTWKANHQRTCTKSHDGSSSSMETACIVDLYRRSVEKRGLRYTVFVGDGDSSSYRSVLKEQVYGPDVSITKENCVGHIQKRMGTKLRKLVQENKGKKLEDGRTISGRGRLTQKVIDSFQVFYGIAIRANKGNLQAMQEATRAILTHYAASPDNPTHELCPVGENSWCKYQVDKALGTDTYRFPKTPLPEVVCKEIDPIIRELSSEHLLKTCQMGYTQNANEACHSMLWGLVPKRKYNTESAYRVSTALTCGHWNSGQLIFNTALCSQLGMADIPECALKTWRKQDKKRLTDAEYKNSEDRKQRRKDIRKEKMKMEDAFQKMEEKSYESGKFLSVSAVTRKCKKCKQPMKGHKRNMCENVN